MFKTQLVVIVFILIAAARLNAAHPTRELSTAEAKEEGLEVHLHDISPMDDRKWIRLIVPLTKHSGGSVLESMEFAFIHNGKTMISSAFPFQEVVKDQGTGRFAVSKSQLKKIKLFVTYREGWGGVTYCFDLPDSD